MWEPDPEGDRTRAARSSPAPELQIEVNAKEFLDADHRGHKNRTWHSTLCENDGVRTKILPPDFVTRFGFMLLCQFEFANRLFKCKLHGFRRCLQGLRQHIQKVFRSFEVTVAQDVDPAYPFCNVFVAKSLYKFAARETELGHPRSDKSLQWPDRISFEKPSFGSMPAEG